MLDVLRDPVWQFIGALLALSAIAVAIWIYVLQKPKKRLLIERVVRVPLITLNAGAAPGLQITMNGRIIGQATVVLVRITNIGNTPLLAADFESPISLEFEQNAIILDAHISESEPKDIPLQTEKMGGTVSISKTLLNPGDSFTCRTLVQDSKGVYTPKARVAGVHKIEISRPIAVGKSIAVVVATLTLLVTMISIPKPMSISIFEIRSEEIPYLVLMTFSFMTVFFITFSDLKARLRSVKTRLEMLTGDNA